MNALKMLFAMFCIVLFSNSGLSAQARRQLTGTIKDSTSTSLPSAYIQVISGKDTLNATSDENGHFVIKGIKSQQANITVRSIGYVRYTTAVSFTDKQAEMEMPDIVLKSELNMLKEVVVRAPVTPVKIMQDTIEYNTGGYMVRDGDYVEDLLKQLPGVEVDRDGNVTAMGKSMTKLRVNGKDFFTSDVKEFIKKLPAEMFSHLQVIDDYGDEANFTGIKIGEPRKMLNLVTKPGRDSGKFGSVGGRGGTNNSYEVNGSGNLWKNSKQIGLSSNFNNTRNSATVANYTGIQSNIRTQLGKKLNGSANYNFSNGNNSGSMLSNVQTISALGTINSLNQDHNGSYNSGHNFGFELNGDMPKTFVRSSARISMSNGSSSNTSSALQSGVIHQDQYTKSQTSRDDFSMSANASIGKRFTKTGRSLMFNFSVNRGRNNNDADILTDIDYYEKTGNRKIKDSLLNRLIETRNSTGSFGGGFNFSEPLSQDKDTIKKNIDISYSFNATNGDIRLLTNVRKNSDEIRTIDSLSNVNTTFYLNQNLRAAYRYHRKKFGYNLGMTVQPNTIKSSYIGRSEKVDQTTINASPSAGLNYEIKNSQSMSINYNGYSMAPDFNQLQPVADTRNLQHVVIGNPDLKASFRHSIGTSFNSFGVESGKMFQIDLNGSIIQNQVASNVILIKDTLNSLKQETRYLNVNGNYNLNANYYLTIPFSERKYNISVNGSGGYANNIVFTDNVRNFNRGFNFGQSVRFEHNGKLLSLSGGAFYRFSGNSYSIVGAETRDIQSWSFDLRSSIRIKKSFYAAADGSKSFNIGYAQGANSPLMINLDMNTSFFKNNRLQASLRANDLLNQGNYLQRYVNQNMIVDSQTKMVTRYISFNLSLRLENFK